MAVEVITEFIGKATVRIRASVYDDDDALQDPTSCKFTIIDPSDETQVDNEAHDSNPSQGIYEYFYKTTKTTAKGDWRGEVEVIDGAGDGAKTSMGNFGFTVV